MSLKSVLFFLSFYLYIVIYKSTCLLTFTLCKVGRSVTQQEYSSHILSLGLECSAKPAKVGGEVGCVVWVGSGQLC